MTHRTAIDSEIMSLEQERNPALVAEKATGNKPKLVSGI